jgi:hypothetical protein
LRSTAASEAPPAPVIDPNAVFGVESAQQALGLRRSTLAREIRLGRLKVSKRGGRYYLLGEWLLDWIRERRLTVPGPAPPP